MAETWRARFLGEAGVTRPVLIKCILPEYADDPEFITMFISEARISATLAHGNIAQVYDFGSVEGGYFLAMELIDGQPLNRVLKHAHQAGLLWLPLPIATLIAIEMSRGLHYAHSRTEASGQSLGIVHRDVSPENVLISYEGQVKLVDFGIAKARELRGFHTEPGVVKGKYLYFSPEQARGEEVDARTDVWATGVVLYEMLCGQLPVKGPQHVVMPRIVNGEWPPARELRPGLPAELEDILGKALALNREERFPSSQALEDALAGFLHSIAPRFTTQSLAYFVQELFRQELSRESRPVQVPQSFLEQLEAWREEPLAGAPIAPRGALAPRATGVPTAVSGAVPARGASPWPRRVGLGGLLIVATAAAILLSREDGQVSPPPAPASIQEARAPAPAPTQETREPAPALAQEARAPVPPRQEEDDPARVLDPLEKARNADALFTEALSLYQIRQYAAADPLFQKCIELAPKHAECHLMHGLVLGRMDRHAEAEEEFRTFLELAPNHREAKNIRNILSRSTQLRKK